MKKNSLQFELSLKISIFFILCIIGVSSVVILTMSNRYNKTIIENINSNMENVANSVDYYFKDVKTPLVMMARNNNIVKAMKNYQNMDNREKLENNNALEEFVQNITTFKPFINDIIIVGTDGYVYNIYNSNQDKFMKKFDFTESVYLREAKEGDIRLYYLGQHSTEYYTDQSPEGAVYSVVLPVRSGKQKVGYIICDIKASVINQIMESNLKENKSKIIIEDKAGNILYEEGNSSISLQDMKEGDKKGGARNIFEILFSNNSYVTRVDSDVTGWTYTYAEPYANFNGFVKQIFLFNVGIILIGLTVIIFFSRQLTRQVLRPLKNIAFMIQEMKINQGTEKSGIFHLKGQNVNVMSIEIERMIQRMDRLINDNYVYELNAKDAQIEVLVNQLSPHFLYNTLQLIEFQSNTDHKENVSRIIHGLSYILRYSINNIRTVRLQEEIIYIRYYLDIYSLRYRDKLSYQVTIEPGADDAIIPKMVLEPVVGNCLKHGFAGVFCNARVQIRVFRQEDGLLIQIEDNGRGMAEEKLAKLRNRLLNTAVLEEHIGLNNVNSIIRLRYGGTYGITVDSQKGEYTVVTIKMPFLLE